ncbi:putative F-box associated domain, type 3 [Helianthus anomalus]
MSGSWCLMSFDMEAEKLKGIQFPRAPCWRSTWCVSVVALDGCIHSCITYYEDSGLKFDLWRMDGDGWTKAAAFSSQIFNLPTRVRRTHIRRNEDWLAILEVKMNSFKNLDLEDFITDYRFHSHP